MVGLARSVFGRLGGTGLNPVALPVSASRDHAVIVFSTTLSSAGLGSRLFGEKVLRGRLL